MIMLWLFNHQGGQNTPKNDYIIWTQPLIQTYCNISNFSCLPWNKLYSEFWSDQIEHLTCHKPFLSVFAVCIDSNLCRVPPAAIISHLAPAREYRHNWLPSFPHSTPGLSLYHHCNIIVSRYRRLTSHGVKVTEKAAIFSDAGWKIWVIWVGPESRGWRTDRCEYYFWHCSPAQ